MKHNLRKSPLSYDLHQQNLVCRFFFISSVFIRPSSLSQQTSLLQKVFRSSSVALVKQGDVADEASTNARRVRLDHSKTLVLGVQTANQDTSIFLSKTPS